MGPCMVCLLRVSLDVTQQDSLKRTNRGRARRPVEALSRPRPSNHPKIRRRKGETFVSLQMALRDIMVLF